MANREVKNGDAVMNVLKYAQDGSGASARAVLKVTFDSVVYQTNVYRTNEAPDWPEGRQLKQGSPSHTANLDYDGRALRVALWTNEKRTVENRQPKYRGNVDFGPYTRQIALWEHVNSGTGDTFWSGNVDMSDNGKRLKEDRNNSGQEQRSQPSNQANNSINQQSQNSNSGFDLSDEIPF